MWALEAQDVEGHVAGLASHAQQGVKPAPLSALMVPPHSRAM